MSNFFEERNANNIEKIREVLKELPLFASEFFVGMASRTTPLTRLNYAYDLRTFFEFLQAIIFDNKISIRDMTLSHLTRLEPFNIEQFLAYLDSYKKDEKKLACGNAAKERKLCAVRSFFKYFYNKNKLPENITTKVLLPKVSTKPILRLEPNEVAKLLDKVEHDEMHSPLATAFHEITRVRDLAILTLMLGTGIRVSECVGLNKTDIDFETNGFTVTRKGGDKVILYFGDEVRLALANYFSWLDEQKLSQTKFYLNIKDHYCLFPSLKGGRLTVRAVENLVKKHASVIAPLKKITPHKLRSTYGTTLYQETGDIYIVADVLGHSDINTTKKHYAAISDDIRRNASKAVKLRE